jgi:putative transposase
MYSREQRELAVERFFASGKSLKGVVDELGYPTRQCLHDWVRADPRYVPPASHAEPYPFDVRMRAVGLMRSGVPARDVAERLGVSGLSSVYAWAEAYWRGGAAALSGTGGVVRMRDDAAGAAAGGGEDLRERVRRLELENAVLREVLAALKADPRSGGTELSNREEARVAARLRAEFPLADVLACLRLARSTFYYHESRAAEGDRLAWLRPLVREAFEAGRGARGYRFVWAWVRRRGARVSEKVVRRVMREEGLSVPYAGRSRRRYSSYRGEQAPAPANVVARDFSSALPNFLWLTDITEFSIPAGKVYLSAVLDCFDGRLSSWSIGTSPDAELANSSLLKALSGREGGELTVVHADRGCHYRWPGWVRICEENGVARSMSAKGCSPDNSRMEGFFGTMKNEFFYYRDWSGVTLEGFASALEGYLAYYNDERLKESLGWMSTKQYRESMGMAA